MPSDLPIITPPPEPRRSVSERYGGLFYLGVAGLLVLVGLLAWFASGLYRLRGVWQAVYALHDASRSESDRIQAALDLSRSAEVTQRQYWDMALRTTNPPLARYLLAESLTSEAVWDDPKGYALAVCRSPGWPDWFRWLIARPLAYAASEGMTFPPDQARELYERFSDPLQRQWMAFVILEGKVRDPALIEKARADLHVEPGGPLTPATELARMLQKAREEKDIHRRERRLNRATRWMRTADPALAAVWKGWKQEGERIWKLGDNSP